MRPTADLRNKLDRRTARRDYSQGWRAKQLAARRLWGDKCAVCGAKRGAARASTSRPVYVQVAHWAHRLGWARPLETPLLCEKCHNRHDAQERVRTKRRLEYARREAAGQLVLPLPGTQIILIEGRDILRLCPELRCLV
jgi:hypothetical protein